MSRVIEDGKEGTNCGSETSDKFPGPIFRLKLKLAILSAGVSSGIREAVSANTLKKSFS